MFVAVGLESSVAVPSEQPFCCNEIQLRNAQMTFAGLVKFYGQALKHDGQRNNYVFIHVIRTGRTRRGGQEVGKALWLGSYTT